MGPISYYELFVVLAIFGEKITTHGVDIFVRNICCMQGKTSASFKDSSLFGVSFSEHAKADFSSSALRCKVCCYSKNMANYAQKKTYKTLMKILAFCMMFW